MGFGLWWIGAVGILLGQAVTWSNLAVWWGWNIRDQSHLESLVSRAVRSAIQDCLDLDVTTTTPEPDRGSPFSASWEGRLIVFSLRVEIAVVVVGLGVTVTGYWILVCCRSRRGGFVTDIDDSPVNVGSRDPPLAVIARNQLAELRLRHHGPRRAIRAD